MAEIRPFGALRFTQAAGEPAALACPPYDIISEEERKAYLAENSRNIIRLELPGEGKDPYARAGVLLNEWLRDGMLACDEQEALYIYEEEFTVRGQRQRVKGFICRVRLEEFDKGVVLPHEETLSKAKEDRFRLMCATGCNFSSIYSLYFDRDQSIYPLIDGASCSAPDLTFTGKDGLVHQVWTVTDAGLVNLIAESFRSKKLYIADGHHRYETALRYRDYLRDQGAAGEDHPANYVMMTLVNMEHEGLVVFPTHRVLRDLSGFDGASLLKGCAPYFDISAMEDAQQLEAGLDAALRDDGKALGLIFKDSLYLLRLKDLSIMEQLLPGASPSFRQLDVNVLHILILERLLGIDKENMAGQKNLFYTRDSREALRMVRDGRADCAFLLNATRVDEIAGVAEAGEKMPQKSTYFYPKLITGHIMNRIHPVDGTL